jgi:hypothetical protein
MNPSLRTVEVRISVTAESHAPRREPSDIVDIAESSINRKQESDQTVKRMPYLC